LIGTDTAFHLNGHKRNSAEFAIDGKTLQLSVNKVEAEGSEGEKILILTDFTDRKLAEYALRTAEKLAATGKLANAIAHEINNPLEALTNLIYLAGRSTSIDAIQDLLTHADLELARIARITKQSLSFHRDTQVPIAIDVGDLVTDIVALFERTATARRVHLVCDKRPTPAIYGFPGQLSQVFGNLVRNAAEAAAPETEVTVRVRAIHRAEREGVRVSIHDRGSGIPIDVQRKMFDPFFTTKDLKGSGLGLWVSKSLVLKHGGTIRFRSSQREGHSGTTFEVFLPKDELDPNHVSPMDE
jgi:signal transduction histidine kinase